MKRLFLILGLCTAAFRPAGIGATEPDATSPVVSYQFLDSLQQSPSQPNIASPVVSYQFLDWLGDENLNLEGSELVSYFFGGGVPLTVTVEVGESGFGTGIEGASVSLMRYNTVFWQGTTDINGISTAIDLPSGDYSIHVSKEGYTGYFNGLPGDGRATVHLEVNLQVAPAPPTLLDAQRTPDEGAIPALDPGVPVGEIPPQLRLFDGSAFKGDLTLAEIVAEGARDRMTVVITHGWQSNLDSWATDIARDILSNHLLEPDAPIILGWDWRQDASWENMGLPRSDISASNGRELGKALLTALGSNYDQRFHFIGHSLGCIVNASACDYFHAQHSNSKPESITKPHVTLLDHAELSNIFGTDLSITTVAAWNATATKTGLFDPIANPISGSELSYKSPLPESAAWADAYHSFFGLYLPDAVNTYLITLFNNEDIVSRHSYAHQWYLESITAGSGTPYPMGFIKAYERSHDIPPTGQEWALGSIWAYPVMDPDPAPNDLYFYDEDTFISSGAAAIIQGASILAIADHLVEEGVEIVWEGYEELAWEYFDIASDQYIEYTEKLAEFLSKTGTTIQDGHMGIIHFFGDIGGTVIFKTGQVWSDVTEYFGSGLETRLDNNSAVEPEAQFYGNGLIPTPKFYLNTPLFDSNSRKPRSSGDTTAPQLWIPLKIPENTGCILFDFSIQGNPGDDRIIAAIGNKNIFDLPASMAPEGSPISTDFLDVSEYAGQEIELYFGLVGGTSNGCTLSISGLRYVKMPIPRIAATIADDQLYLQWSAAATGWKLQRSTQLAPDHWEDVPLTEARHVIEGVVLLQRPRSSEVEFFRLKLE